MEDQKRKIYSIFVNSYIRSDDCLKKEYSIRKSLGELYKMLSVFTVMDIL